MLPATSLALAEITSVYLLLLLDVPLSAHSTASSSDVPLRTGTWEFQRTARGKWGARGSKRNAVTISHGHPFNHSDMISLIVSGFSLQHWNYSPANEEVGM